jgi:hypothetical protein
MVNGSDGAGWDESLAGRWKTVPFVIKNPMKTLADLSRVGGYSSRRREIDDSGPDAASWW